MTSQWKPSTLIEAHALLALCSRGGNYSSPSWILQEDNRKKEKEHKTKNLSSYIYVCVCVCVCVCTCICEYMKPHRSFPYCS